MSAVLEAEEAVLGSLLIDAEAWLKVATVVRPEDFSRPDHRLIFQAAGTLAGNARPPDLVTLSDHLKRTDQLDAAGGMAYLLKLARDTPTSQNVVTYADIVLEHAVRRRTEEVLGDSPDGARLAEHFEREAARLKRQAATVAAPLPMSPVSQWAGRPAPAPRDWIIEGLVPARRLTSFFADGGLGKTRIALQVGVHVAAGRALYGLEVSGGPVLGIFCEDEQEELERRIGAACAAERLELADLDRLIALSRDGEDNVLCTFKDDRMVLTPFYEQLEATVAKVRPRLLIIDTLADVFAGNYLSTPHVRQFTKTALGGLCTRHECGVLLVAHPSSTGIESGRGDGFSTAWHNSVRSRIFLRRPNGDPDTVRDRRVLELKKANYGPDGVSIPLVWQAGIFVPDHEPVTETPSRAPRVDTGLAIAARDYFRAKAGAGSVVSFGATYDALQSTGALPPGQQTETVRKKLARALSELTKAGFLVQTKVPRGYRLAEFGSGHSGQTRDNLGTEETSGHWDTRDTPTGQGCPCPEMSLTDVPAAMSRENGEEGEARGRRKAGASVNGRRISRSETPGGGDQRISNPTAGRAND